MKNKNKFFKIFQISLLTILLFVLTFSGATRAITSSLQTTPDFMQAHGSPFTASSPIGVAHDNDDNLYIATTEAIYKSDSNGDFLLQWGSFGGDPGQFNTPYGIALDSANNVYVADTENHRIQKFDSDGNYITQWGGASLTCDGSNIPTDPDDNGKFCHPRGVALDSDDNVYVSDTQNDRVQKFDSSGNYLDQWGGNGSGNGEFNSTSGIAIDTNDNVYVADIGNFRIQKFNSSGAYLGKWGSNGFGDGEFRNLAGITTDSSDNVYVVNNGNDEMKKFTSSGSFLDKWGSTGSSEGLFNQPSDVSVDSQGNVYVADTSNFRVQIFKPNGDFLARWGVGNQSEGQINSPTGITTDSSGNVYVADTSNHRIQKFDSSGVFTTKWGSFGTGNSQFKSPTGITTDSSGNVYVADTNNHRIQKFDSSGVFTTKWGSFGTGNSQFKSPSGITTDSSNNVYVADTNNHRIQKFDSSGNYLGQWGGASSTCDDTYIPAVPSDNGKFCYPYGITLDSNNDVYVFDTYNNRIQKFDSDGNYQTQWGSKSSTCESTYIPEVPSDNGKFCYPMSITVDSNDNIYVVDEYNNRIQKFDSDGNYQTQWGSKSSTCEDTNIPAIPSDNGKFCYPTGIALGPNNDIYVLDTINNRIQKFRHFDHNLAQLPQVNSSKANLTLPSGSNITSHSLASASQPDGNLNYPMGLLNFTFTTPNNEAGVTIPIEIIFQTDLTPSQVIPRKYNSNTQVYSSIPGASVVQTSMNGKPALKLTYSVTDGGSLDQDGTANGTIVDPVGLATTQTDSSANAPNTGLLQQNPILYGVLLLLGVSLLARLSFAKGHKTISANQAK